MPGRSVSMVLGRKGLSDDGTEWPEFQLDTGSFRLDGERWFVCVFSLLNDVAFILHNMMP